MLYKRRIIINKISKSTNIAPETLSLLNPYSYAFTSISPSEIELQINGQIYTVNLDNYVQFYQDLELQNVDTLAKYLKQLSETQEEIIYTKFYPSQFYELDSRGYITINVPFNGKVVATIKYSTNNSNQLTETSYISNNYLGSAVLLTDSQASTTQIIQSDAWGVQVKNDYNPNIQTPTTQGFTGHKWDENSGLTYMHARYMNNQNRSFLSQDPMSITSFSSDYFILNPQFQNSYSYASNDPVNNVDPDGRKVEWGERQLDVREIFSGASHSFLKITPNNQGAFPKSMYGGYDANGDGYFTISVTSPRWFGGQLGLEYNYKNDIDTVKNGEFKGEYYDVKARAFYLVNSNGQDDTEFIKKIMSQVDTYQQDGFYDVTTIVGYNCHEYTSTLVQNAGGQLPGDGLIGVHWGLGKSKPEKGYVKYPGAYYQSSMNFTTAKINEAKGGVNNLIYSANNKVNNMLNSITVRAATYSNWK